MKLYLTLYIILATVIRYSSLAKIPSVFEKNKSQSDDYTNSLYDVKDKVLILDYSNLKENVFEKQHATVVQFFNNYCGHCKNFAPTYKKFGIDIEPWNNMVILAALDCARYDNSPICREFEVMSYPSIRYFPPNYPNENNRYGIDMKKKENVEGLKLMLINQLKDDENRLPKWPDLKVYSGVEEIPNSSEEIKFIFVINESGDSTVGASVTIDLYSNYSDTVKVYRVAKQETDVTVMILDHNKNVLNSNFVQSGSRDSIKKQILQYLNEHSISPHPGESPPPPTNAPNSGNFIDPNQGIFDEEFVKQITDLKAKDTIFQADLEIALNFSIFVEISGHKKIEGDQLLALQNYLSVNANYFPLGANGREFLRELRDYSYKTNGTIFGEEFEKYAHKLEKKYSPVFSSTKYIGCYSGQRRLRGYSCALWTLFHYLSVQSAEMDYTKDKLEVLQAMYRYIKYFFGCTWCSKHFEEMAKRRKIWSVPSKDEGILWLWEAHNEVNKRLSGDKTEDPQFPKIQFPSVDGCLNCHRPKSPKMAALGNDIVWDKTEVLYHMKKIYSYENLHRLGVENESVLPPSIDNMEAKRSFGTVLTDLDMRMGMLLYIFCIVMMIVAVKYFLRRGYRKKMYVHDILGKV